MSLTPEQRERLATLYPAIDALPADEVDAVLSSQAMTAAVPAGTVLFEQGAPCRGFPMVLSGSVRVARGAPSGRSLELYRVQPGDLCIVSTGCLYGSASGPSLSAHGVAAADTEQIGRAHV